MTRTPSQEPPAPAPIGSTDAPSGQSRESGIDQVTPAATPAGSDSPLPDPTPDYFRSIQGTLTHLLPGGGKQGWRWERDDMAQDMLLDAIEHGHSLHGDPQRPWPEMGFARHAIRRQVRRRRISKLEHAFSENALEYVQDGGPPPDAEAEREELRGRVRAAVNRLPPRRREVVMAVKLEGLSVTAFASSRRVSVVAVRALLKRSMPELRLLLGKLDLE